MFSVSNRSVAFPLIFSKIFLLYIPQDSTYEETLKIFCKAADGAELRSSNYLMESVIVNSGDINIQGVVVGLFVKSDAYSVNGIGNKLVFILSFTL